MSVRKTNFIKPQRVPVEPVNVQRVNKPNPIQNKLDDIRERRAAIKAERPIRNNVYDKPHLNNKRRVQPRAADPVSHRHNPRTYAYKPIPKIWQDETVYIVAGGASLKGFDFSRLNGKKVIAINKAYQYVSNPDVLYWTDGRFYNWYKNEIDMLKCLKFTVSTNNRSYTEDVTVVKNVNIESLDFNSSEGIFASNNSGFAAIVLAIKLGAKKIYLLGYDMNHTGGKSHFHGGYPNLEVSREHIYKSMLKNFNNYHRLLEKRAQIYNTNPKSNLRVFPMEDLNRALLDS
jgi:uncharacterized Rossmann fold enzyme